MSNDLNGVFGVGGKYAHESIPPVEGKDTSFAEEVILWKAQEFRIRHSLSSIHDAELRRHIQNYKLPVMAFCILKKQASSVHITSSRIVDYSNERFLVKFHYPLPEFHVSNACKAVYSREFRSTKLVWWHSKPFHFFSPSILECHLRSIPHKPQTHQLRAFLFAIPTVCPPRFRNANPRLLRFPLVQANLPPSPCINNGSIPVIWHLSPNGFHENWIFKHSTTPHQFSSNLCVDGQFWSGATEFARYGVIVNVQL
ncbi:hypothetical protein AVEN_9034-1 [Araneus ventricosus]|uniref:Uncharacterized protein n=1 Tax=Araneus ventricosus TaxID=182803 RepID=A0A4Y2TUL4_ARAVE|nr:hypothetical protein AVEN_9034-1 [Araneus ventricosus]